VTTCTQIIYYFKATNQNVLHSGATIVHKTGYIKSTHIITLLWGKATSVSCWHSFNSSTAKERKITYGLTSHWTHSRSHIIGHLGDNVLSQSLEWCCCLILVETIKQWPSC